MRPRSIEPINFSLLAIVLVTTFVFQLVTLLYCASIYPATRPPAGLVITVYDGRTTLPCHPPNSAHADRPLPGDLETYHPLLAEELARYPRRLIQKIRLEEIILCSNLRLNGKEIGGLTRGPLGTVILNVRPGGLVHPHVLRLAIHHEIFHVMDCALVSAPGAKEAWARLNPSGFEYGGPEILDALEITGENPGRQPETSGFLDYYSMVGPQEDRAEIFASMMVSPDRLETIAAEDGVVSSKRSFIKRFLQQLDEEFASVLR